MLDVFRGLKNLIKVNYIHIDSPVFRLHYSITVILLISFSLIVTTRQYVGNPIDCIHTKDIPEDVLNTYCWIHSTYTLKSFFNKKVGVEVPYPGIGNSREKGKEDMSDRKIYKYYQWVCFCLFFQVCFFFFHFIIHRNVYAGIVVIFLESYFGIPKFTHYKTLLFSCFWSIDTGGYFCCCLGR